MSEPKIGHTLRDVLVQLASAQSALNMYPEGLPPQDKGKSGYLSETDKWAHHAYAHIEAAVKTLIHSIEQQAGSFPVKMMPGQTPYTPGQLDQLHALVRDAADANVTEQDEVEHREPKLVPTLDDIRKEFWRQHTEFDRTMITAYDGIGRMYPTDVRCAWTDYLDTLAKDGRITSEILSTITLIPEQPMQGTTTLNLFGAIHHLLRKCEWKHRVLAEPQPPHPPRFGCEVYRKDGGDIQEYLDNAERALTEYVQENEQ